MKLNVVSKCLAVVALNLGTATAHAATVWDEAHDGDLSNDGLSPTPLVVGPGSNLVLGVTGSTNQGIDRVISSVAAPAAAPSLSGPGLLLLGLLLGSISWFKIARLPTLRAQGRAVT